MFRDNFTDFAFNDIESKAMKVWITNARDIQEQLVASFQDHFITPSYTDGRHYAGTSITSQTLTVKCAAVEITEKEKRNISQWLNPRAVGALTFGFDPYHYYNVKVASEIVADKWVRGRYHKELGGYTYIYNFTIKFITTDDWCKLGHPVNLDLNSIFFTTEETNKLIHPFQEISNYSNIEDAYNIFSNFNNSYALPYVLPVKECFIQEPQEYDLEKKPNISELDSSLGNFVSIDEDYVYAYFAIKGTNGLETSPRTFICNPGNEPMYFNYFYTKDFTKGSSPEHSIKIDEETIFSFKLSLLENFSSTLNYDSYVGVLSDGGVMLPLIEGVSNRSIIDSNELYENIGQYFISPGNAETIKLSQLLKIELVGEKLNPTIPTINLPKDSFVFDHYGLCVVSMFNTLPRHGYKYSICSTKEGLTFTNKDNNDMLVFGGYVKSNGEGDIQILISSGEYTKDEILPYKYLSICNASFLNIESEPSNSCYLTLQTRGN
jgi:hypothetical protein